MKEPLLDLDPNLLAMVREILCRHLPEFEVRAFGSRVNGTAKKYSDLDLVVMTPLPLGLARLADIEEVFSESDLPMKVDVVDWASTPENFRKIIEQQYVVIQQGEQDIYQRSSGAPRI